MSDPFWTSVEVAPEHLRPHPRNPRTHSDEQIEQIRGAIREQGFTRSVLITHDNLILAGHGAVRAAVLEALPTIPARRRSKSRPLTEQQALALIVGDNKIAENAGWDAAELAAILGELKAEDYPLDVTGFSLAEADALFAEMMRGAPPAPAGASAGGGYIPGPGTGPGSLSERFLVVPFSVLNAREGWWQARKQTWLSLGIRSEIGRGANLIGRSPQELFCHFAGVPYAQAREIVAAAIAEQGDAFDIDKLIEQHTGRKPDASDFSKSGAVVPNGPGGLVAQLSEARGYRDKLAPGGTGTRSAWLRRHESGFAPTAGGINSPERADKYAVLGADAEGTTNALFERLTTADASFYMQKRATEQELGRELTTAEFVERHYVAPESAVTGAGTSIFDPVLCELVYRWFCPPGGAVLDPFAGGSVRGILAAKLGRTYTGIELRAEQIDANNVQAREILGPEGAKAVRYIEGDACDVLADAVPALAHDLLFTCPPYFDLEQYSEDPRDLSTMEWEPFLMRYGLVIARAAKRLRDDRFAAIVVGEVRDSKGMYRGFVPATIQAFEAAGLRFYNEAILVTAVGSLPIRAGRTFAAKRKLGKTHQNVLVFIKGDPAKATEACGTVDVADVEQAMEALVRVALKDEDVLAIMAGAPPTTSDEPEPIGGEI